MSCGLQVLALLHANDHGTDLPALPTECLQNIADFLGKSVAVFPVHSMNAIIHRLAFRTTLKAVSTLILDRGGERATRDTPMKIRIKPHTRVKWIGDTRHFANTPKILCVTQNFRDLPRVRYLMGSIHCASRGSVRAEMGRDGYALTRRHLPRSSWGALLPCQRDIVDHSLGLLQLHAKN